MDLVTGELSTWSEPQVKAIFFRRQILMMLSIWHEAYVHPLQDPHPRSVISFHFKAPLPEVPDSNGSKLGL